VTARRSITVLAGGYGGAKLSHGLALASEARERTGGMALDLSIVVNTGDDLELHGLDVSPDLDTVMYTLAGLANAETGWGVRDETWSASAMLERYGAATWFRLGDRDIATHLRRTQGLRAGRRLTEVTAELAGRLGVDMPIAAAVDAILNRGADIDETIAGLLARPFRDETGPRVGALDRGTPIG